MSDRKTVAPGDARAERRARLVKTILGGSRERAFEALAECHPWDRYEALLEACKCSPSVKVLHEKFLSGQWTPGEMFERLALALFIEERAQVENAQRLAEFYTLMSNASREASDVVNRIMRAAEVVVRHGPGRDADEKQWLLDQVLRAIAGESHAKIVERLDWSEGTPPRSVQ